MVLDGAPPSIFVDATGLKVDYRRPSSLDSGVHVLSNQDRLLQEMVPPTAKISLAGARQQVTECSTHFWVSFRVSGNIPLSKFCPDLAKDSQGKPNAL